MNSTLSYKLPSQQMKRNSTVSLILLFSYIAISYILGLNPFMIFTDFKYVANLANEMVPPNFSILWTTPALFSNMYATISMAFLGTVIGGTIAILLSFFAARNVFAFKIVTITTRSLMAFERVTPNFIVLLLLQCIFGVGPFSGMISLAIGSFGMFGKLLADSIEHIDQNLLDSISTTGASRLQVVRYGIIPQVLPTFISMLFYAFDVNMRRAIELGMFGGGGLGYELHKAAKTLQYKDQMALIIVIIVVIAIMERISDFFRRSIFRSSQLK